MHKCCRIAAAVSILMLPAAVGAQPRYTIVQVNGGGISTWGNAINNSGTVVGRTLLESGRTRAFRWSNGSSILLASHFSEMFDSAVDVNDEGHIVGVSQNKYSDNRAILWTAPDTRFDLGALSGNDPLSATSPRAINNAGQIIGTSEKAPDGPEFPVVWSQGTISEPPPPPSYEGLYWPGVLNDLGMTHGTIVYKNVPSTAGSWQIGSQFFGSSPGAVSINNLGWVLSGSSLWRNGSSVPLRGLAIHSQISPKRVTDSGFVGGDSTDALGRWRAVLFNAGSARDLSKWLPEAARLMDLNDFGQVLVGDRDGNNTWLMTPNYRLNASPFIQQAGKTITVTWNVPPGRPSTDWIGLYRIGADNSQYLWHAYTGGAQTGSFTVEAPSPTGNYEFRYLINNSFEDFGFSNFVEVTIPSGFSLTASPSPVNPGDPLTVSWTAPAGQPATDWIALYKVGQPNRNYMWWRYTGGATSGSFTIPAPGQPGQYEFRYLYNDRYTDLARSNPVTVNQGAYTLAASPSTVNPGDQLTVSWTAPQGTYPDDWIGFYRVGAPDGSFLWWRYTNGAASGSVTLPAPTEVGQYEFRYFLNARFTMTARSNAVTVEQNLYSVSAAPSSVIPGGTVTVSWTAPTGTSANDWIALFPEGEPDNHNYLWPHWFYTGGGTSGSRAVTMPSAPGRYVFRYLLNNGYTHRAESLVVTVQ